MSWSDHFNREPKGTIWSPVISIEWERVNCEHLHEDFAEWVRRGRPGPPVVWLRIGNSSKKDLLDWLEPLLPVLVRKLEEGERLVEIR